MSGVRRGMRRVTRRGTTMTGPHLARHHAPRATAGAWVTLFVLNVRGCVPLQPPLTVCACQALICQQSGRSGTLSPWIQTLMWGACAVWVWAWLWRWWWR